MRVFNNFKKKPRLFLEAKLSIAIQSAKMLTSHTGTYIKVYLCTYFPQDIF